MNTYFNSTSIRFIIAFLAIIAVSVGVVSHLSSLEEKSAVYGSANEAYENIKSE